MQDCCCWCNHRHRIGFGDENFSIVNDNREKTSEPIRQLPSDLLDTSALFVGGCVMESVPSIRMGVIVFCVSYFFTAVLLEVLR